MAHAHSAMGFQAGRTCPSKPLSNSGPNAVPPVVFMPWPLVFMPWLWPAATRNVGFAAWQSLCKAIDQAPTASSVVVALTCAGHSALAHV